jgi:hypothetical protein
MKKLTRDDLMSLEEYSEARDEFRNDVLAHKRNRRLELGTNAALYFEDRLTMQYQVQEMLRIERIFETAGINDELDAYNPLIPDGSNWKATFMIEFPEAEERRAMLQQLRGVEDRVYVRVGDFERVFAIADEDLRVPSSPPASTTTATPLKYLRYRKISEILCSAISIKATCGNFCDKSCGTRAIRLVHA